MPHELRHGSERKKLDPLHDSKGHWERRWLDFGHLYWRMVAVLYVGGFVMAVEARLMALVVVYPLESQRMVLMCLVRLWDHF